MAASDSGAAARPQRRGRRARPGDYTHVISLRREAVLILRVDSEGRHSMDHVRHDSRRTRLPLAAIPELARPVGMYGTMQRTEVGGAICFGVAVAFATYRL
jgi:hypothetical protein